MKILIVDDDRVMTEIFNLMLQKLGFDVTCENSGQAAIPLISADTFDVIFLDYEMGDINGVEVHKQATANHPLNCKFIFLSCSSAPELAKYAAENKIQLLAKPPTREGILSAIAN